MNSDRSLTFMWLTILLIAACVFGVAACGAPVFNQHGLSWDNSAAFNREAQRTERERISANRDIRVAEEWNDTMRTVGQAALQVAAICVGLWAASKAIPAIVASLAAAFAAWAARPHRPQPAMLPAPPQPPPHIILMAGPWLEAMRDSHMEYDEQADAWLIVSDTMRKVHYLTDSQP